MAIKRERLIPPSQILVEQEERAFEKNRLLDALGSHESAIPVLEGHISAAEAVITTLDELLTLNARLPQFTTGHMETLRNVRSFDERTPKTTGVHVGCVRSHAAYLFQTSRAVALTKLNHAKEQLVVAKQNIESITQSLKAFEEAA